MLTDDKHSSLFNERRKKKTFYDIDTSPMIHHNSSHQGQSRGHGHSHGPDFEQPADDETYFQAKT
jgi:hypothetical protein